VRRLALAALAALAIAANPGNGAPFALILLSPWVGLGVALIVWSFQRSRVS
jgi:hypothetical protein